MKECNMQILFNKDVFFTPYVTQKGVPSIKRSSHLKMIC